jgi:hypothetical protein
VARSAGRGSGSQFIVTLPLADRARTTAVVAAGAGADTAACEMQ